MRRCGWCSAPTLNGALCRTHGERLRDLLEVVADAAPDLDAAVAKAMRWGEQTRGGSQPGLVVNVDAMEVRREVEIALGRAVRAVDARTVPDGILGRVEVLRGSWGSFCGSWQCVALLGDLEGLVKRVRTVTDKPRRRLEITVPCPQCGDGPLTPTSGGLKCAACGECSTLGAVRRVL